jgi:3-oxoacyl-[acyl-carrier protein] reductase
MGRVQDKVTIITGAGENLGQVIAQTFSREGAPVVVAGRRPGPLEETVAAIESEGGTALAVPTDVTDESACERLVAATVERFGRVDVLVNNASHAGDHHHIWKQTLENWNGTLAVALTGPMLLSREVLRQSMLERKSGAIVNIGSTGGITGVPTASHYAVAKAGLRILTKVTALEAGPHGIRVNEVIPGAIQTGLFYPYAEQAGARRGLSAEAVIDELSAGAALRKIALPEEVAAAALFFASDEASAVTGQALVTDAGMVMPT